MIHHHAVLLVGDGLALTDYRSADTQGNTEYESLVFDVLTINDVRQLIKSAYSKPYEAATKTVLIEAKSLALEAQQALLKLFEEPPESTKFVLALPHKSGLLPTLLSRLYLPAQTTLFVSETNPFFTLFHTSGYAARLETITHITKDKEVKQIDFLCDGVLWFVEQNPSFASRSILLDCVTKVSLRGASKKMLLEEIALTLPLLSSSR
jgi:hypothetical protein